MTTSDHQILIRPAALADLDVIVSLWMEMMGEHEQFDPRVRLSPSAAGAYRIYAQQHVTRTESPVVVAECDGRVVGYCLAYRAQSMPMFHPPTHGYISDLVVNGPWRGRGIGTALLEHVKGWFQRQGVDAIQLQVYSRNAKAMNFWRRAGFDDFVHGMWLGIRRK